MVVVDVRGERRPIEDLIALVQRSMRGTNPRFVEFLVRRHVRAASAPAPQQE